MLVGTSLFVIIRKVLLVGNLAKYEWIASFLGAFGDHIYQYSLGFLYQNISFLIVCVHQTTRKEPMTLS